MRDMVIIRGWFSVKLQTISSLLNSWKHWPTRSVALHRAINYAHGVDSLTGDCLFALPDIDRQMLIADYIDVCLRSPKNVVVVVTTNRYPCCGGCCGQEVRERRSMIAD